jgi:hypothetical protein
MSSSRAEGSLFSNSVITSHLLELGYPKKSIDSMEKCGKETGFKFIKNCGCDTQIIRATHHCSLRTCESCAKIRKRRTINKYLPHLEGIYQTRRDFLYFLTISPENYSNLEEGLEHIKKSWSKFIRHDYIKKRIKGGFYVIETKRTEGN